MKACSILTGKAFADSLIFRERLGFSAAIAEILSRVSARLTVNVRDYGASPNASAARNIAAFRLAEAALPNGGRIVVPAGAYDLTASRASDAYTIATSGLEVRGEGDTTVLLTRKADSYSGQLFGVVNVGSNIRAISDIGFHSFKIQGPVSHTRNVISAKAPRLVNGVCVNLSRAGKAVSRVSFIGVKATRLAGCGFQISGGDTSIGGTFDTLFDGCWAFDTRNDGFNVIGGNVYQTTATGNHAVDCDGFGFEMAGAGMLIADNVVQRCGQAGIGLELNPIYGKNYRAVIRSNTIEDCYTKGYPDAAGISLGQSTRPFSVDILNNFITRVGGNGIDGGPGGGTDIVIEGNTIKDIGKNNRKKTGINLTSPRLLRVRNNKLDTRGPGFTMDYGIVLPGVGSETNIIGPNAITGALVAKHSVGKNNRVID